MLTTATIYNIAPEWAQRLAACEQALKGAAFVACLPSQEKSVGWIAPRQEANGAMIETSDTGWTLMLQVETKAVPGALVKRRVEEAAAQILEKTGRKPGKRERKALKEDIIAALMPHAFPKLAQVPVWIDREFSRLVVGAAGARADEVVTHLVIAFEGFAVTALTTRQGPEQAMSIWLSERDAPHGFTIDRECELKSTAEGGPVIRYVNHALDIDEVARHIEDGLVCTNLALTWADRVSFVLNDHMALRKITFLGGAIKKLEHGAGSDFDANVFLSTTELRELIPALVEALGGASFPSPSTTTEGP